MRSYDVPYPNGLDRDSKVFAAYRVPYQPATVLITASGRVHGRHAGGVTREELSRDVAALVTA